MQNNFDKLNEIFGVKPEGGEETAAKEEAREPETAPEQAAAPEPAGEETKVINPLRDSQPVPEKPAEEAPQRRRRRLMTREANPRKSLPRTSKVP